MNTISHTFETERLLLRKTTLDDASFIQELLNTPKWLAFIGDRNVHTIADAKAYIKSKIFSLYDKFGYGNYTVVRKLDGAKIGNCGLYNREGIDGVDIGFAFLPEYEGKGYGFESAAKVKEIAVTHLGITTIYAITRIDNKGSQKLLEKLGLTYQKMIILPDNDEELMLYKLSL